MKTENITPARKSLLKLIYSALFLALAMVLPFLTGQIPEIGAALSPLHIPALLCGLVCGWPWGLAVGFVAPLLRCAAFGMPMMPGAAFMAFEMATYGAVAGILYKLLPKKVWAIYASLISAMVAGRIVWGIVRFIFAGLQHTSFPFSAFLAGAVLDAIPGIVLHIVLIPIIVMALKKAKLMLNE